MHIVVIQPHSWATKWQTGGRYRKYLWRLRQVRFLELTVSGFGSRIRLISFLAPDENHDGQEKSALQICKVYEYLLVHFLQPSPYIERKWNVLTFLYKAIRFDSSKGKNPAISTKRITPQDQTSDALPSYPLSLSTWSEKGKCHSEQIQIVVMLQSPISIKLLIDTSGAT